MSYFLRVGPLTVGSCPVPAIVPSLPTPPCPRLAQIGARSSFGHPVTCGGPLQPMLPPRPFPSQRQMPDAYLQSAVQAANQMLNRHHLSPQGPQVSWLLQRKLLSHRFPGIKFSVDRCVTEEFRVNGVRLCYNDEGWFTGGQSG